MRAWALAIALSVLPACEGLADIPNSTIICCERNGERFVAARIDCVYDPDGRVVSYDLCPDGGPPPDAGPDGSIVE